MCDIVTFDILMVLNYLLTYFRTDNDTDQYTSTNPNENCDSGRVPIPKSTRFMDYIPATTSTNRKVLIKNRGKYYPPPPSAAEIDPIIVCACCGRKAETSVKCFSCKRSYHRRCHIPSLPEETTDDAPMAKWKCTMCINITKLKSANTPDENRHRHAGSFSLSPIKKKIAERILMELYCRGHDSQHYEECPDRQKNPQYYQIIARPISLNAVRNHLNSDMYTSFGGIVEDLNMVFSNGLLYYWPGDARRNAAMNLQDSLRRMLREWMPASKRSK
uniref:Transcription intermediary factor 1-alpha n=1 Tax=Sipha flava TaxID=143950 RepID=A0A2S2R8G6_9HEMI